jgi:hypothetical protein
MKGMTMKKLTMAMVAMVAFVGLAMAAEQCGGKRELRGRDIVRLGKAATLSGTLAAKDGEWQVKVGQAAYDIHLGPCFYREEKGLELKDGGAATVTGFLHGTDMAVSKIQLGDKTYVLRDATGRPAWAGRGQRRNQKQCGAAAEPRGRGACAQACGTSGAGACGKAATVTPAEK